MSDYFGSEPGSWNVDTDGKPGVALFGAAIQVWAMHQTAHQDVWLAAAVFNVPWQQVVEAVEHHGWMFLDGEGPNATIEHEGE